MAFQWKKPSDKLNKTTVEIVEHRKKMLVVTLFWTTNTILVQGKQSENWTQQNI